MPSALNRRSRAADAAQHPFDGALQKETGARLEMRVVADGA